VLVLAPHTEDGEIGCGGTIAKLVEEGKEVSYVAFSADAVPEGFGRDTLEREVMEATGVLGLLSNQLMIYGFRTRNFPHHRQEILERMVSLYKNLRPDTVFAPSLNDMHQDHKIVAEEALRAFKMATILGYEEPWNNVVFGTTAFVVLEEHHIMRKLSALGCYKTQMTRPYLTGSSLRALAITRGNQIQKDFAEAFEVVRLIV